MALLLPSSPIPMPVLAAEIAEMRASLAATPFTSAAFPDAVISLEPLTAPDHGVPFATCMRVLPANSADSADSADKAQCAWVLRPMGRGGVDLSAAVHAVATVAAHEVCVCVTHMPPSHMAHMSDVPENPILVAVLHTLRAHTETVMLPPGKATTLAFDAVHDVLVIAFRPSGSASVSPVLHAAGTFVMMGRPRLPHVTAQLAAAAVVAAGHTPILLRLPRAACAHCGQACTSASEMLVCDACCSVMLCERCARTPLVAHSPVRCLETLCVHALGEAFSTGEGKGGGEGEPGSGVSCPAYAPAHLHDVVFHATALATIPFSATRLALLASSSQPALSLLSALARHGDDLPPHERAYALQLLDTFRAFRRWEPSYVAWPAATIASFAQRARLQGILAPVHLRAPPASLRPARPVPVPGQWNRHAFPAWDAFPRTPLFPISPVPTVPTPVGVATVGAGAPILLADVESALAEASTLEAPPEPTAPGPASPGPALGASPGPALGASPGPALGASPGPALGAGALAAERRRIERGARAVRRAETRVAAAVAATAAAATVAAKRALSRGEDVDRDTDKGMDKGVDKGKTGETAGAGGTGRSTGGTGGRGKAWSARNFSVHGALPSAARAAPNEGATCRA